MFCTQCGTQIDQGKKFCRKCGASTVKSAEPATTVPPATSASKMTEATPMEGVGQTATRRIQSLPISPSREGRGVNMSVIAAVSVVVLILAGAGVYYGTDLFRSTGSETVPGVQEPVAKVEELSTTLPVQESKAAKVDDTGTESDFNSPLWTTPGAPLPPIAMESLKPTPEARAKPAPKTSDSKSRARKSQNQTAAQPSRAGERAPAPPTPASVSRPAASPGTYQTIRPTRVFESPTVNGRIVARIDDGIRVNVVGSTGDWLEVRSRSGNPPGFIRRDDAVRVE